MDAFAGHLNTNKPYPVKVINWGYWGNYGVVKDKKYKEQFYEQGKILWNKLSWNKKRPLFSKDGFKKEINSRFKAITAFINANGYYGLHMGHIVLDDKKVIKQYRKLRIHNQKNIAGKPKG